MSLAPSRGRQIPRGRGRKGPLSKQRGETLRERQPGNLLLGTAGMKKGQGVQVSCVRYLTKVLAFTCVVRRTNPPRVEEKPSTPIEDRLSTWSQPTNFAKIWWRRHPTKASDQPQKRSHFLRTFTPLDRRQRFAPGAAYPPFGDMTDVTLGPGRPTGRQQYFTIRNPPQTRMSARFRRQGTQGVERIKTQGNSTIPGGVGFSMHTFKARSSPVHGGQLVQPSITSDEGSRTAEPLRMNGKLHPSSLRAPRNLLTWTPPSSS